MRAYPAILITFAALALLFPSGLSAQRLGGNLDVTRSRIGDERVQRQTEVMRLERMLEAFETRITRLERQLMRSSRFPAITIAEAEAAVEFAKAQLQESEHEQKRGTATPVQVASDQLALARAQGQLESATAAVQENILTLEMDVVYAERRLLEARKEKEVHQRLAAKGYTSSDSLQFLILNEGLAEKELQLAKMRLQAQRKSAGQAEETPPATLLDSTAEDTPSDEVP